MPERVISTIEQDETFVSSQQMSQQYASMYFWRLSQLRAPVEAVATSKWESPQAKRVLDIPVQQRTWVVGTIYRDMKAKPNIIDDLTRINHGMAPEHPSRYEGADDVLYLEDDHGRIEVRGNVLNDAELVTGVVIGVIGEKTTEGIFFVDDLVLPGFPSLAKTDSDTKRTGKVALVSGLLLDETEYESPALGLLAEYLGGMLGDEEKVSSITRLVIAGDSLTHPPSTLVGSRITRPVTSAQSIARFAAYLRSLASVLPVHLLPGAGDPVSLAMPQLPFHKGLLGRENAGIISQKGVILETNPAKMIVDGVTILGSAGQPLHDLQKYTSASSIELLQRTLMWRHMAPTAPDTLWTRPFADSDPFLIEDAPHIYFSGNMDKFATVKIEETRLVSLPRFAETKQIVLIDLETLEVELVSLEVPEVAQ